MRKSTSKLDALQPKQAQTDSSDGLREREIGRQAGRQIERPSARETKTNCANKRNLPAHHKQTHRMRGFVRMCKNCCCTFQVRKILIGLMHTRCWSE